MKRDEVKIKEKWNYYTRVRMTKSYNKTAQKVQKGEVEGIFSNWGEKATDHHFGRQSRSFLWSKHLFTVLPSNFP